MAEIYLIRHGQASFGESNYDKLSDLGKKQGQLLGQFMKESHSPSHIICGGMSRHRETLDSWLVGFSDADTKGNELSIEKNSAFNEFDHENILEVAFPEFKDKDLLSEHVLKSSDPKKIFHGLYQNAVDRWISGQFDGEYSESFPTFAARCIEGIESVVAHAKSGESYFIFTSGGPIGMCLKWAMKLNDQVAFALNSMLVNSGVTRLVSNRAGECAVSYFNNFAHLQHEARLISYR